MHIQFISIEPHPLLKNHIEKIWLFKSSGKMPADDMKLVVPNGNIKLTISYQNGIIADLEGKSYHSKEYDITLTGLINVPVILDVDNDLATETLGIEFSPRAAYRFFRINFNEIHNRIFSVSDIFDRTGIDLIDLMNGSYSIQQKLDVIQNFLLKQLYTNPDDQIFEYCIDSITKSKGTIPVKELERKTGYSSRWLNMKFNERIGVSPKGLASIIRFSQYYGALLQDREKDFFKNSFYALYYDQSHFIKDFKRFTGLTPTKFEKQINDFGKIYYLD